MDDYATFAETGAGLSAATSATSELGDTSPLRSQTGGVLAPFGNLFAVPRRWPQQVRFQGSLALSASGHKTQGPPVEALAAAQRSRQTQPVSGFSSCLTQAKVETAVTGGERVLRIRLHLLPRPVVRSCVFEEVRAIGKYREACPDVS